MRDAIRAVQCFVLNTSCVLYVHSFVVHTVANSCAAVQHTPQPNDNFVWVVLAGNDAWHMEHIPLLNRTCQGAMLATWASVSTDRSDISVM
jgi:hypothetical protein